MISRHAISDPIKRDWIKPVELVDRFVGERVQPRGDVVPDRGSVAQRGDDEACDDHLERRDRLGELADVAFEVNPPSCRTAHRMPFSLVPICASAAKLLAPIGSLVVLS